ncbi:Phosphodiest-domain-containing protein, partial [Metschnikowia bicuspidata var. bicuspidata NRRL YB-4993]
PHKVDVPVLDLDEPDDDTFPIENPGTNLYKFMDLLDYANQGQASNTPGILRRIQNFFKPNDRTGLYEPSENNSDIDFFNIDDDDAAAGNDSMSDLRKYQITRLERKLNKTILCFACGLVFVFAFLFLKKDGLMPAELPLQKILLSNSTHVFHPTTLLISLDGFHPHYINAENTPTLHRMLVDGYGAPHMVPSFPSLTFPNHWTLVTGLYPADHGIVGNTFYDPLLKKQFINTNPDLGLDPQFWQGGEPVWTTAAKQGVRSAIHMWPGSEVPGVGDNGPTYIDKYNGSEPLAAKADRIFSWLDIDDLSRRPELILAYVPTIDQFGHKFGISGPELTGALRYVDEFVQLTQDKLAQRNLQDIVNVIVVSDHGMAPTSNDRLLFLDDVVEITKIEHIDGWPLFGLRPRPEHSVDEIYLEIKANLDSATPDTQDNFNLYRVEEIPPEWQFGGNLTDHKFNYRLAPIWIVPNVGYSVTTRAKFAENNNDYYPKGVHGYNNTHLLMRAIFLGQGPYFEQKLSENKKVLPFTNVNVYNIVCETLQITPGVNNGTVSGKGFSISTENSLPDDWSDNLVFPDLPYEVEHIVRNATYDQLW